MLDSMTISNIKYLCFGCEKCKDTENELFVYSYLYDKVYLGTKGEKFTFSIWTKSKRSTIYMKVFSVILKLSQNILLYHQE